MGNCDMRMKGMKKTKGRTSIQDLENSLESIMPSGWTLSKLERKGSPDSRGSMEFDFISLNLELLLCLQHQRSLLLL